MKNCTNHFLERWVERIVGISDKKEIKQYIVQNGEKLKEHANKTFDNAEHIFTGQLGDNITRNFYVKDNIVMILNTTNDAMITVYKVDFGFPETINNEVRKGLIKEIKELRSEYDKRQNVLDEEIESDEQEVASLKDIIAIEEEKLANLKKQLASKQDYIKTATKTNENMLLDIKKYTLQIVNSKHFRDDLKQLA